MTRDEILNMSAGKELDELIARQIVFTNANSSGRYHNSFIDGILEWFKPSTDISDAWLVIEKLKDKYDCKLDSMKNNNYWSCSFISGTCEMCNMSYSETAPLAVCRAALLTKFEEGNKNDY